MIFSSTKCGPYSPSSDPPASSRVQNEYSRVFSSPVSPQSSLAAEPPLPGVPGVGILSTLRHLQLVVVELVVLVALEEVGLAVGVGGGRVQVVGDLLPTPLAPGQSSTRL